jgi:hypothetical protein
MVYQYGNIGKNKITANEDARMITGSGARKNAMQRH